MTTIIGNVQLDHDMIWENEFNYTTVFASATKTLGGGLIVQEFPAGESGRSIILISSETQGLQKKSTVEALKALSNVPNATYPLIIQSNSKSVNKIVRFMNEESDGAVQFSPIQERDGLHSSDVLYKGRIYLMVIE
jgi:hypothetical protein